MKKDYLKYFLALLLFGSNGIAASHISLSSTSIVLQRSVLGCLFLIILFFASGHRLTVHRHRRDLLFIALSGAAMGADWLLLFEAYSKIGVGLSLVINYCGPAVVVALSPFLLKERLTCRKAAAVAAAALGAALISGQAVKHGVSVPGIICAALSALSYAAMVLSDKLAKDVTGMENSVVQLFFAAVTIGVFSLIRGSVSIIAPIDETVYVLWLGIVNTGLGCYFYFSSIGTLSAQTVSVCGYIEPLTAAVLSAVFLGERMLPLQIAGAALIIGGAVFSELPASLFRKSRR